MFLALELYKKLGLIYLNENDRLMIANYDEMVGSETSSAKRVREWRAKQETQKKALQCNNNSIIIKIFGISYDLIYIIGYNHFTYSIF